MPSPNRRLARFLIPATALLLAACAGSSPPPLIQTQVIKVLPPAALLDCPVPAMPAQLTTRDQERKLMLDLAAWGSRCRAQLDAVKQWEQGAGK